MNIMAHFTDRADFLANAVIGDTYHEESPFNRYIRDAMLIDIQEDEAGNRKMLTQELTTQHNKMFKRIDTILRINNYTTEPGSIFVRTKVDPGAPYEHLDVTEVARYSKKALEAQHATYKGAEQDPDYFG